MRDVVIVSAVRTAVGRYMGALKSVEAYDLAALVLKEAFNRVGLEPAGVVMMLAVQAAQMGLSVLAVVRACELVGTDPRRAYQTLPVAVSRALDRPVPDGVDRDSGGF